MKHSLLITKYLLRILESNNDLKSLIDIKNIYPVDARLSSQFPFAVIQRTSINAANSKDGNYEDTVYFTVAVVDDNYVGAVTIADKIRETFENNNYRDDDIYVHYIRLTSSTETIYNDTNVQLMDFSALVS